MDPTRVDVVTLFAWLLQFAYCRDQGLPNAESVYHEPQKFLVWLKDRRNLFLRDAIAAQLGVAPAAWTVVDSVVDALCPWAELRPLWPVVALQHRPPPTRRLASMSLVALLRYDDGVTTPIVLRAVPAAGEPPLNDGDVGGFLASHIDVLADHFRNHGVDGAHRLGKTLGDGAAAAAALNGFQALAAQFKPEFRQAVLNLVDLVRTLLPVEPAAAGEEPRPPATPDRPPLPTIEDGGGLG